MERLIHLTFCLISLFLLLFLLLSPQISSMDPYSEALLGLKSKLIDASNSLHDWTASANHNPLSTRIHACSWTGITCTKNSSMIVALDISWRDLSGTLSGEHIGVLTHLMDLNLSHNSLSGHLPPELPASLTNLRSLDISRNNFNGSFPAGISSLRHLVILDAFSNSFTGELPAETAQLSYLKVLNLAGSYFSGSIPAEFGSFQRLEFLHLAGNLLSGEIPTRLGKLQTLTHMELGYNLYQGSVPWQLCNMSNLQYLDIAGANLSGSLPHQLSELTKLSSLFLFRNRLSGPIPPSLGNLTMLVNLDLSDNLLSGELPTSLAGLKNLRLLSLMRNELSGSVSEKFAELPSLESLFIWSNRFTGALPENLGKYSGLKWVDVSTNKFSGKVPPGLCSRGKLAKLMLFSNQFTGELSSVFSNCSSLVRLRVEDNGFTGLVPLQFNGHSQNITYVDLSRNSFTGEIPREIYRAEKLQYFNISYNRGIAGEIPEKIWSLPMLQNFSAASCNLSGSLPQFHSCKSFSVIEMSDNNLTGSIPSGVLSCRALETLSLRNNRLNGHLPLELASLSKLSVLDLSHNEFTGPLPEKLGNSSSLVLFNVSFNNFSGSIPSSKAFKLMGANAFIGNPGLCGEPLEQRCSLSMEIVHVGAEKITWMLIICSGVVLFIVTSISIALYVRRRSEGKWRMVSFEGLPRFTANDVLKSLSCSNSIHSLNSSASPFCKAVLPTGITVQVKKIECSARRSEMVEVINQLGNVRHLNIVRLLGYCGNEQTVYLLYDYLPNGNLAEKTRMKWDDKYKVMVGIARGLCFLHRECNPAIPHGDLRSINVLFDENMEPHLAEFGLKHVLQMNGISVLPGRVSKIGSFSSPGERLTTSEEEIHRDVYCFGEILIKILSNGRLRNAGESIQTKATREVITREIYKENEESDKEEIMVVLQVAELCTKSRPSARPSMEYALARLCGLRPQRRQ